MKALYNKGMLQSYYFTFKLQSKTSIVLQFLRIMALLPCRFVLVFPFGVHGKPPFLHPLLLLKQLADAPKRGGSNDADNGRHHGVLNADGADDAGNADQREHPPWSGAEIVFRLDDDGVEDADNQEGAYGDSYSCEVHRYVLNNC